MSGEVRHLVNEMHRDEYDFHYAVCDCGYRSTPVPDIDILIDEMMAHAQRFTSDEIRAAVAAYLDPTEVEWCTTHNISAFTDRACWQGASLALGSEPHGCQIETKNLLDPLVKNADDEEE